MLIKKGDELVGMGAWEREGAVMTLYARLGVIAPAHRGARMAVLAMELGEKMGRAMGAGFIYTLATMEMPQMQLALERAGYQLIGFMPGYDREEVSPPWSSASLKSAMQSGWRLRKSSCGPKTGI